MSCINKDYTKDINTQNIENVREQISYKLNYNTPYYADLDSASSVLTDYDVFPYNRWYRGEYDKSYPIVAEREAGFRRRRQGCYRIGNCPKSCDYPDSCFQYACSVVTPCRPGGVNYEYLPYLEVAQKVGCIPTKR